MFNKQLQKRIALTTVCLGMCGALFTGCGSSTEQPAKQAAVTWNDNLDGKDVQGSVTTAPKKAVSLSQATTEMMLTLGLENQMAGTAFLEEPMYAPLVEQYKKVPVLSDKWPSYEQFMAVKPDFVTGWGDTFSKRWIPADKILSQHIPIFVPDSMQDTDANLDTLFNDMLKLGEIFGKEEVAQKWVDGQKEKLAAIQKKIGQQPTKRVLVFDSSNDEPFTVFGGYTENILKLIGAENVMSGQVKGKTWGKASWESVIAANPDYIIVVDYDTTELNSDSFEVRVQKIKNNPQLQSITAVKENHFIKVKLSEITPGVRTVDALERLAATIHGAN